MPESVVSRSAVVSAAPSARLESAGGPGAGAVKSGTVTSCRSRPTAPAESTSSPRTYFPGRSEEHMSELQSRLHLVCRLLLEKKKKIKHHKRLQSPIDQRYHTYYAMRYDS